MNAASLGAMSAEQGYVTISRGRERGMIFTNLAKDELLDAIRHGDRRKSATELLQAKPPQAAEGEESRLRRFAAQMRVFYRRLHDKAASIRPPAPQRGLSYGR